MSLVRPFAPGLLAYAGLEKTATMLTIISADRTIQTHLMADFVFLSNRNDMNFVLV